MSLNATGPTLCMQSGLKRGIGTVKNHQQLMLPQVGPHLQDATHRPPSEGKRDSMEATINVEMHI